MTKEKFDYFQKREKLSLALLKVMAHQSVWSRYLDSTHLALPTLALMSLGLYLKLTDLAEAPIDSIPAPVFYSRLFFPHLISQCGLCG